MIDTAPACAAANAPVRAGSHAYPVLPAESSTATARHGSVIAVPLYDGALVPASAGTGVVRYAGTVNVRANECIRTRAGAAVSHRVALFRVVGVPGDGAVIQVRLRLPALRERCVSCRTVHFFVTVV